jgi:hypothetical protein
MHGAHKLKNVLLGADHPQYRNGEETLEAKTERSSKSVMFRYLNDLENYCGLFCRQIKVRGRHPLGYTQLDLADPKQLAIAILKTLSK